MQCQSVKPEYKKNQVQSDKVRESGGKRGEQGDRQRSRKGSSHKNNATGRREGSEHEGGGAANGRDGTNREPKGCADTPKRVGGGKGTQAGGHPDKGFKGREQTFIKKSRGLADPRTVICPIQGGAPVYQLMRPGR